MTMNCYNCHFSPTGGTGKVSMAIAEAFGNIIDVEFLYRDPDIIWNSDDIGIFSVPSYGGRVPTPAAARIGRMKGNGARAVLVAVFGNRAIDDTLIELQDLLTSAGFTCVAGVEAVAEHSLMHRYGAGRPDKDDIGELRSFGRSIRESMAQDGGKLELPGKRPYVKYGGVPLKPSVSSACIGCGKCALECPAGAIPASDFRKTDKEKCISCMHCVSICPVHARTVSRLMTSAASLMMGPSCSGRKANRLYLPS